MKLTQAVARPGASAALLALPARDSTQLRAAVDWAGSLIQAGGRGPVLLFSGANALAAAAALAKGLGVTLYRIDLSAVVGKYIGETEKNLAAAFAAARRTGAVLLFDEADALFGKRSDVKDSHDRYANIEIGYLLQRLESYAGIVVIASSGPPPPATWQRRMRAYRFPPDA